MKAKYIGCVHRGWEHTDLEYEYRGYTYFVTKDNNGCLGESLRKQHNEEQAKIDERISHKNIPVPKWKYEGSAQEGLDLFFDSL